MTSQTAHGAGGRDFLALSGLSTSTDAVAVLGIQPTETPVGPESLEALERATIDQVGELLSWQRRRSMAASALVTDVVGLLIASLCATAVRVISHAERPSATEHLSLLAALVPFLFCVPVLVAALGISRSRWRLRTTFSEQLHVVVLPLCTGGMLCLAGWRLAQVARISTTPSVDAVLLLCMFGVTTVAAARVVDHLPPRRHGRRARHVLIVGSGTVADRISDQLDSTANVRVVGYVDDDPKDAQRCLGKLADLTGICHRAQVDHVVVAFSRSQPEEIIGALRPLQGHVPITIVPRLFDVLPSTANVHDMGSGLAGISVAPVMLGWWPRACKRTIDIAGASILLLICAPVLALVGLAVRLTSPGPILIRQTRIGRDGEAFSMFKFRSMFVEHRVVEPGPAGTEPVKGPFYKLKRDPRVTRVGRVIRSLSIDELPQLWNVLQGSMSLVGPRPFVPDDSAWIDGWASRRYSVRPGITGLWQVSGRNDLTFDDMCRLDHLYVSCWSVGLDLRILIRTLRVVLQGRGAY